MSRDFYFSKNVPNYSHKIAVTLHCVPRLHFAPSRRPAYPVDAPGEARAPIANRCSNLLLSRTCKQLWYRRPMPRKQSPALRDATSLSYWAPSLVSDVTFGAIRANTGWSTPRRAIARTWHLRAHAGNRATVDHRPEGRSRSSMSAHW